MFPSPGMKPSASPPTTSRIGYGTRIIRAIVASAITAASRPMRIASVWCTRAYCGAAQQRSGGALLWGELRTELADAEPQPAAGRGAAYVHDLGDLTRVQLP